MEIKNIHIRGKFCADIENQVRFIYTNLKLELQEDLKRLAINQKLEYIEAKQIELSWESIDSNFKYYFHKEDIKTSLRGCLEKYFNGREISQATKVISSDYIKEGNYEFDLSTSLMSVYPLKQLIGSEFYYNFSKLYHFKELPEYIAMCQLDIELDLLYDQYLALEEYYQEQELSAIPLPVEKVLNELENTKKEEKLPDTNFNIRIFKDPKAFKLFEFLLDTFNGINISHTNCSFIFGQMKKDTYILNGVKEKEFRDFLSDGFEVCLSLETQKYQISMDKLKTLEYCTPDKKMSIYSKAINLIYTK